MCDEREPMLAIGNQNLAPSLSACTARHDARAAGVTP